MINYFKTGDFYSNISQKQKRIISKLELKKFY